jgi:chromosome segregation ATPase
MLALFGDCLGFRKEASYSYTSVSTEPLLERNTFPEDKLDQISQFTVQMDTLISKTNIISELIVPLIEKYNSVKQSYDVHLGAHTYRENETNVYNDHWPVSEELQSRLLKDLKAIKTDLGYISQEGKKLLNEFSIYDAQYGVSRQQVDTKDAEPLQSCTQALVNKVAEFGGNMNKIHERIFKLNHNVEKLERQVSCINGFCSIL